MQSRNRKCCVYARKKGVASAAPFFTIKISKKAHTDVMKQSLKIKCAAACSAFLLLFSLPKVAQMSSLEELSMPYLGYYSCESIRLGGKDCTEDFSFLRLELKRDGVMVLQIRDTLGKEQRRELFYDYVEGEKELTVRAKVGDTTIERKLPFENGEIVFTENLGGRLFVAKFTKQ